MEKHLSSIDFKDSIETYKNFEGNYVLHDLAKINLCIGANNSGKSRFIRALFSNEEYLFLSWELEKLEKINDLIIKFQDILGRYLNSRQIQLVMGLKYVPLKTTKETIHKDIPILYNDFKRMTTFRADTYQKSGSYYNGNIDELNNLINEETKKVFIELEKIYPNSSFTKCYIPILRGLRPIGEKSVEDGLFPYTTRTLKDYFLNHYNYSEKTLEEQHNIHLGVPTKKGDNENFKKSIITGLNFYEDCKIMLLGSTAERKKVKEFEDFLSRNFFNGKEINIIPRLKEDGEDTHIVYLLIDEEERPIHEFGDGIQSIITLTYHMFFNKDKPMCYFIEEPDVYLHPGYQRIFLNLLSSDEFESHQFFITTHSNHFLDYTMDADNISIYTFKKASKEEYVIENVSGGDMKTLELLGVRNSSVFLSNCTIWVEGITDRLHIRRFLELYFKKHEKNKEIRLFLEDVHYSFLEYGGGNITHWSFLEDKDDDHPNINVERLCSKLFLVTDDDGAGLTSEATTNSSAKKMRQEKLEKTLGERYYCLESREIENCLPEETIKNVIKSYNVKNEKADFSKIRETDYKNEKLGKFIDENVKDLSRKFGADSGTVTDKVNFCKKAIKNLKDYDSLTEDGKGLTTKIIAFIEENNQ